MTQLTLPVFTPAQLKLATDLLSAKVATMIGRKMEEADWDFVYCNTKMIPSSEWSNLHIDINYEGLGVEHKMLRVKGTKSILEECGTTKMHPAGTRSIRIPDEEDPNLAMKDILGQYCDLIDTRTEAVIERSDSDSADMRVGWLLWKETLDEFLYFEERMVKPDAAHYIAEWNVTPARGARKASKSLWIYEKSTGKKKYSVTTTAGAKIQPYFDVPSPANQNLYHFKVQGVRQESGLIKVWLTKSTAKYLELLLGSLEPDVLSEAILNLPDDEAEEVDSQFSAPNEYAIPVSISEEAYEVLKVRYENISDEYMLQQFAIGIGGS